MDRRTICIGDIHGCFKTFSALLGKIELDSTTTIVLMGDYVDRGRDAKAVLDLILHLQQEQRCVALAGNHEQMLFDAAISGVDEDLAEFLDNGGEATLRSFGVDHPAAIPQRYLDFIRSMPVVWQNETHVCVHGWLTFAPQKEPTIRQRYEALWNRSGTVDPSHLAGRSLVVGHSVVSLNKVRASLKTRFVRLDNGCVYGSGYQGRGNLVALELGSNELFAQPNID